MSVFSDRHVLFMLTDISYNRRMKARPFDPNSRDEGKYNSNLTSGLYDCGKRYLNFWGVAGIYNY